MADYYDDYSIYGADPGMQTWGWDPMPFIEPYAPEMDWPSYDAYDPWAGAAWDMGVPPDFQWQDPLALPEFQAPDYQTTDFGPGFEPQPWEGIPFSGGYMNPPPAPTYPLPSSPLPGLGGPGYPTPGPASTGLPGTPTARGSGGLFGVPGLSGDAVLGLLSKAGGAGLSALLAKGPLEDSPEMLAAKIDLLKAQAENARQPRPSAGGGGGGTPGPFPPQRPGGIPNLQEFLKSTGLLSGKGGLNTLYSQSISSQEAQIKRAADQQRAQVMENATKMGVNPAAQLAEIDRKEQELMAALPASVNQSLAPLLAILSQIYGAPSPTGPSRY